jgi:general secretion pathway protein E
MSSDYAQRRGILPVEVNGKDVTIATSEPLRDRWERELSQMLRAEHQARALEPGRHRALPGRVLQPRQEHEARRGRGRADPGLSNFEQLVELGKAGARSTPTTTTSSTWSTGCGSTPSTSARATSTSSRAATWASCASASTACCTRSTRCPFSVLVAMTSRIKILGRMDVVEKRRPQDGRIKTRMPDGEEIELRLSTLPTATARSS